MLTKMTIMMVIDPKGTSGGVGATEAHTTVAAMMATITVMTTADHPEGESLTEGDAA